MAHNVEPVSDPVRRRFRAAAKVPRCWTRHRLGIWVVTCPQRSAALHVTGRRRRGRSWLRPCGRARRRFVELMRFEWGGSTCRKPHITTNLRFSFPVFDGFTFFMRDGSLWIRVYLCVSLPMSRGRIFVQFGVINQPGGGGGEFNSPLCLFTVPEVWNVASSDQIGWNASFSSIYSCQNCIRECLPSWPVLMLDFEPPVGANFYGRHRVPPLETRTD